MRLERRMSSTASSTVLYSSSFSRFRRLGIEISRTSKEREQD